MAGPQTQFLTVLDRDEADQLVGEAVSFCLEGLTR